MIRALRAELGPDMPIVDTFFDPFQQVLRKVGFSKARMVYDNEREALHMLDAVTETVCGYLRELKNAGCDGVLYSINGAITPPGERGVDERTFRTFLETFDLKVLESMQGLVRILHVHGTHVDMRRVLDYPCEVFSVSDRLAGNPSLSELRTMTDKCLMDGIDETRCTTARYQSCATRFATPFRQAGKRRFILAPGCTSAADARAHLALRA